MADRPKRRFRRLLQAVIVGLGVIAIAGAVLWLLLPAVVGRLALDRLAAMGVPDPRLEVLQVGYDRAVIVDVAAGADDAFTADEIVVTYRYPEILDGVVESVAVRGATLRASVGPDGVSLGSLDPLLAGNGDGALPALPPIRFEEARLDLATGFGAVAVTGGGTLGSRDGRLAGTLDLAASASQGAAAGRLDIEIAGDAIDARLQLAESRIELPDLGTAAAHGTVDARFAHGEIAALDGDVAVDKLLIADPRAAGLGPLAGNMTVAREGDAWRASAKLHDARETVDLAARFSTPRLDLTETAVLTIDLEVAAAALVWPLLGLPSPSEGRASIDLVTRLVPAMLIAAVHDGRLPDSAGSIAFDLDGLAYAGTLRSLAATGGFDFETAGDALRLTAATPVLSEIALDPAVLAGLPAEAARLIAEPLTATVGLDGTLELRRAGDGSIVTGAPSLAIDLPDGHRLLDARAMARLTLDPAELAALELSSITAQVDIPVDAGLPPATLALSGTAAVADGNATADLGLAAAAPSLEAGGLRAGGVKLDLPVALAYHEDRLTARLTGKGALSVARVTGTAPLRLDGPVQLPFIARDVPVLAMDFSDPQQPQATLDVSAGPLRLAGTVEAEHGPMATALAMPRLVLHAALGASGWSGKLTANDGTLGIPTYDIEATDLDLAAELPEAGAPTLAMSAGIAHRAEPAIVVPLSASLNARQVRNGWTFTGSAADAFQRLSIEVEGRHDLARNRGSAKLEVAPIEFAPDLRQPADLAPFLAGMAEEVSGTVALAGDLSWSAEGVGSDLELLLRDVSAVTEVATIDRLNGVIAVDGLSPFTTPPGQRVAVAAIDAGLPLTDGLLTFRVAPGRKLEIAGGLLHLAGGTVNLEPLTFDPAGDSNAAVLAVTGVDLGELLALAGVDGLTGEGRMSGRIPVTVRQDDVIISNGQLEAEAPGWLSYAPLEPPAALQGQGETVSLALSALTNFHYQALRLTVDRQAGGQMVVAMHVRGNNPDFYDGYPVEFNLNVSGELDRVLRRGLAGYRIPAAIEEQLKEFAQ